MRIFREVQLSDLFQTKHIDLNAEVKSEDKNRLLNVNETEYLSYLVNRYRIEPLVFAWDSLSASYSEKFIPAEQFPFDFSVEEGESYPKQVITFHLPFTGHSGLLRCKPSSSPVVWGMNVDVIGNDVLFDIINWRDDPEELRRKKDEILSKMRVLATSVEVEVEKYNVDLKRRANEVVRARKEEHLKHANLMASLGVPFKKAESVPATFAIGTTKKQPIIKPSAPSSAFNPEPMLEESVYRDILRICHDTGIEMERHPSIYRDKDEETLRDHFILVLSPHFQSVTGETFNKTGKTDILIRHDRSNVFVAECKFWSGIKGFYKTIDQALGYLTWRDSKAAILCFIKNKELNPILEQIELETVNHPCFLKYHGRIADSWFDFEFHLTDDPTRGVRVAVLCFHFTS
jgi:hypothetical protein